MEDSAVMLSLAEAARCKNQGVAKEIQIWYLSEDPPHNSRRARLYIKSILRNESDPEWASTQATAHAASARLYLEENRLTDALREARTAWYIVSRNEDDVSITIDAWLLLGKCLERTGEKLEAYRCYHQARLLAERSNDKEALSRVMASLSFFNSFIGDYPQALRFRENQIRLLLSTGADSVAIKTAEKELAAVHFRNGDPEAAKQHIYDVISFAARRDKRLLRSAFTVLRSNLIERGDVAELQILYQSRYPKEFRRIAEQDTLLHARMQAMFADYQGETANARRWYALAENIFPKDSSYAGPRSRFHQRYGQFLLKHKDYPSALAQFELGYKDALISAFEPFVTELLVLLDSTSLLLNNYEEAYRYAKLGQFSRSRQDDATRGDYRSRLELESEQYAAEIQMRRDKEATTRRHNLQFTGIAIAIILAFIGVLMARSAHVSPRTMRIISFLSFILLFEFIILLADLFFHVLTHGEPWILILIKLVFIAGLSQLHHWLEHKLAHYLASHEPLTELSRRVKSWWRRSPHQQSTTAPVTPHIHPPVEPGESENEVL